MAKRKFQGSIDQLKLVVEQTGSTGEWRELANGQHQFKANDGAILNWWLSKGTLNCQGPQEERQSFERVLALALDASGSAEAAPSTSTANVGKSIFIVHGHDTEARDQLELILRRLGLEPFILMSTSGEGKTIIEALEGQIGKDFASDFGIVLLTPDDVGYAKVDGPEKAEPRARQNVVLETGMLLASLTRDRMVILKKGHLDTPSDLGGVIYLGFNDHVREVVPKLCKRLQEVGFEIDSSKIAAASA